MSALAPHLPAEASSLAPFVDAELLSAAEVHTAAAVARRIPGTTAEVLLAVALAVRARAMGHVCLVLDQVAESLSPEREPETGGAAGAPGPGPDAGVAGTLPWPEVSAWADALRTSPAVTVREAASAVAEGGEPRELRPLVFDGTRIYLDRYWGYERRVGDRLLAAAASGEAPLSTALEAALTRFFGPADPAGTDLQRRAASLALRRQVTVLAGGPGTGKTYTIARTLAAACATSDAEGRPLEVALAAPTGKAAARMGEALQLAIAELDLDGALRDRLAAIEPRTIHRLLGVVPGGGFRHGPDQPLAADLVVIDETSMVDLPLMAKLFDALRPDARLVLVGDPFQLASVEAGAVLGDVVGPAARGAAPSGAIAPAIVVLQRVRRFEAGSPIARLADAVRDGDPDAALAVLRDPSAPEVELVDPTRVSALDVVRAEVAEAAAAVVRAAQDGDAVAAATAATARKVLCGTRRGPLGSSGWTEDVERRLPRLVPGVRPDRRWYPGRPVIITRNDYVTNVFNGDTGIVVARDAGPVVAIAGVDGVRELAPSLLDDLETWWAMTVHKSQGSEFDHVIVSLPEVGSPILTNELLYTGVTRGKRRVTVVASEASLRAAIGRPIRRASGLQARLWS